MTAYTADEWLHDTDPTGETMAKIYTDRCKPAITPTTIKWHIDENTETYTVNATYPAAIEDEETEQLRQWIAGQNSDGLGESLEQHCINGKYYSMDWQPVLITIQEEPNKTTATYKGNVNITEDEDYNY